MHPSIERLTEIMPPSDNAGHDIDWAEAQQAWGTEFPDDFKDFTQVYGPGTIENYLYIGTPQDLPKGSGVLTIRRMTPDETMLRELAAPFPAWPLSNGLIGWGGTADADCAYWRTAPTPQQWHIVLCRRHRTPEWVRLEVGFADFLLGAIRQDLGLHPFSGSDLYDHGLPRFISRREEQRLTEDGIDPWAYLYHGD